MYCDCKDWIENIDIGFVVYELGLHVDKDFVYCPWCGKKLTGGRNLSGEKLKEEEK